MTRGDVYEVRFPSGKRAGHEQRGRRYAVILQVDELLELSTVIVAPTSTRAHPASFRPEIEIGDEPTRVLVEQLRAIDVRNLARPVGHLTANQQAGVDDAVALVLGL